MFAATRLRRPMTASANFALNVVEIIFSSILYRTHGVMCHHLERLRLAYSKRHDVVEVSCLLNSYFAWRVPSVTHRTQRVFAVKQSLPVQRRLLAVSCSRRPMIFSLSSVSNLIEIIVFSLFQAECRPLAAFMPGSNGPHIPALCGLTDPRPRRSRSFHRSDAGCNVRTLCTRWRYKHRSAHCLLQSAYGGQSHSPPSVR